MCGVIGDVSEENGLILPDLACLDSQALYAGGLPEFATAQNPLDTTGYVGDRARAAADVGDGGVQGPWDRHLGRERLRSADPEAAEFMKRSSDRRRD